MLNEFGKALRKIRIEHQELLKDMADKLGVSSAYLSAVETGKRRIPQGWVNSIVELYSLDSHQGSILQDAMDRSVPDITIPLDGASMAKRDAVLSFARALDGLSDEELSKIMSTMKKKSKGRGEGQRA